MDGLSQSDSPTGPVPPPVSGPRSRYSEASEDSDIVLKSSDNVQFHFISLILKLSSSVFRDMFAIPLPPSTESAGKLDEPISLPENADTLCLLLDTIYPGRGLLEHLDDIPYLSYEIPPLLKLASSAAIKYNMTPALKAIRAFLMSQEALDRYDLNAVQLYGVAWDLEFTDEAKWLSTRTLGYNLNSIATRWYLARMSLDAVLKLQELHQQRKVTLLNSLSLMIRDSPCYSDADEKYGVDIAEKYSPVHFDVPWQLLRAERYHYGKEVYEWELMKGEVSRIMEERPDGSDFFNNDNQFFYDEKFAHLRTLIDGRLLAKEFKVIFATLPKAINC